MRAGAFENDGRLQSGAPHCNQRNTEEMGPLLTLLHAHFPPFLEQATKKCVDTTGWVNSHGTSCTELAQKACLGHRTSVAEDLRISINGSLDRDAASPDLNCCACGKAHLWELMLRTAWTAIGAESGPEEMACVMEKKKNTLVRKQVGRRQRCGAAGRRCSFDGDCCTRKCIHAINAKGGVAGACSPGILRELFVAATTFNRADILQARAYNPMPKRCS